MPGRSTGRKMSVEKEGELRMRTLSILADREILYFIASISDCNVAAQMLLFYTRGKAKTLQQSNNLLEKAMMGEDVSLQLLNDESIKDLEYTRVLKRTDEEKK